MPPTIKNKSLRRSLKALKDHVPKSRFMWGVLTFFIGRSAYHQLGWFKSAWRAQAVDAKGEPIPWMAYPAIDFLERKCQKKLALNIWEFGSGNSTLWWAKRSNSITAVEHNQDWHDYVTGQLKSLKNAEVIYAELGDDYPAAIVESKRNYDIIVIDGRMRVACAKSALKKVKNDGVIVWDNSDRAKYQPGISLLTKAGFKRIDFVGLLPISNCLDQTTIFYRPKNVLDI